MNNKIETLTLSGRKQKFMPVEAYTESTWFEWEMEEIFEKNWQFAGLVEDVNEAGKYKTVQVGRYSIFIVRGDDQEVRAFHNMCCHRGTQLLRATGKAQKVITCPYHDWTYSLEGKLTHVPEKEKEFPNLNQDEMFLTKAGVELWRGMVFVHPHPEKAEPFQDFLADFEDYLGPHKPELLVEYEDGFVRDEINANWKIVLENYIDCYHLAHLHSGTLNMYDHSKIEWKFCGKHYAFFEPLVPEYLDGVEKKSLLPLIDHVPASQMGAYVPMMFPNIGMAESEASWSTFHIIPVAVDKTIVDIRTKVMPVSDTAFKQQEVKAYRSGFWSRIHGKFESDDPDDPMASGDFIKEDIYACEQQQKALRSPLYRVGASAKDMEASVGLFQQNILRSLGLKEEQISDDVAEAPVAPNNKKQTVAADSSIHCAAEIMINGERVDAEEGETILEAGLREGVDMDYSCKAGVCGRCKTKLCSGKVEMKSMAALSEEEVEQGLILACQSRAITKQIEIKKL